MKKTLILLLAVLMTLLMVSCQEALSQEKIHTVSYVLNGKGDAIEEEKIVDGYRVSEPKKPVAANYVFDYWYETTSPEIAYDFSSPVTKDLVLYARWHQMTDLERVCGRWVDEEHVYSYDETRIAKVDGKEYLIELSSFCRGYIISEEQIVYFECPQEFVVKNRLGENVTASLSADQMEGIVEWAESYMRRPPQVYRIDVASQSLQILRFYADGIEKEYLYSVKDNQLLLKDVDDGDEWTYTRH